MDKHVHSPTGNVDRPPRRDERQGSRALERDANRDRKMNEMVDEASEESFPASDPPAWTSGSSVGAREHTERAPGISVVENVEPSNVTGQADAQAASRSTEQAARGKTRGRDRNKGKQRVNKSAEQPRRDDEDTLDMSRDRDRDAQGQRGAIPQQRDDDRNQRHQAVQGNEQKQQAQPYLDPEHTDDRTDLAGRRSASEGPHEVFPGERRVTPPKPVVH